MEKVLHYKDSRNDKLNFGNSHSYSAVDNLKQTYRDNGAKTKRVQAFDVVGRVENDENLPVYTSNQALLKAKSN